MGRRKKVLPPIEGTKPAVEKKPDPLHSSGQTHCMIPPNHLLEIDIVDEAMHKRVKSSSRSHCWPLTALMMETNHDEPPWHNGGVFVDPAPSIGPNGLTDRLP